MVTARPTLRCENGCRLAPGDRIGDLSQAFPGSGTYARGGQIFASVLGQLAVALSSETLSSLPHSQQFTVTVTPHRPLASSQVIIPGKLVLARVVRISPPQAELLIVAVEGIGELDSRPEANIRREDVLSGSVREMQDSFQPGDMVLARVVSLGDSRAYLLSTTDAELGVIQANGSIEAKRKLAKPRKIPSSS